MAGLSLGCFSLGGRGLFCYPWLLNLAHPTCYALGIETSEKCSSLSVIKVGSQQGGVQRHQPSGVHAVPYEIGVFKLWLPLWQEVLKQLLQFGL